MIKKNIPNMLTLGNLSCGLVASFYAFSGDFNYALYWVFGGIVFDFFDGFAARLLKVSSPLGLELDSLADMVTAGVVPGMVMYKMMEPMIDNKYMAGLGFLITLGSAMRLAKFNIDTRQSVSFIGLPTPANALFVISLGILIGENIDWLSFLNNYYVLLVITLISTYMLNSEIPLFALKFKTFEIKENMQKIVFLIVSVLLLLIFRLSAVPFIIIFYVLLSVVWKPKH